MAGCEDRRRPRSIEVGQRWRLGGSTDVRVDAILDGPRAGRRPSPRWRGRKLQLTQLGGPTRLHPRADLREFDLLHSPNAEPLRG